MSYSLHNLDTLMLEYINYNDGFFIEAGANDRLSQSNTAVEGYEMSVLNGMDFSNVQPKYFLIETANRPEYQKIVRQYMKDENYLFVKQLSGNDDLFLDNNL